MSNLLVVTDLDGSLLDHHSYSCSDAEPAMQRLRELNIPLVFNSSKTLQEMLELRAQLGNQAPFVVENGAALYLPESAHTGASELHYGLPRAEIQAVLLRLNTTHSFRYQPFYSMSVSTLVELTGLSPARAGMALERSWSEPLYWQDSDEALQEFTALATQSGLHVVRGGRFVHVSGQANKGSCLADLRKWYELEHHLPATVLALGDGANDLPLLAAADIAVQIMSPIFPFPDFTHPHLIRTTSPGPAGWQSAVMSVLDTCSEKPGKI